jgi:hypothetical protein
LASVLVEHPLLDEVAWIEAWESVELLTLVAATYRRDSDAVATLKNKYSALGR